MLDKSINSSTVSNLLHIPENLIEDLKLLLSQEVKKAMHYSYLCNKNVLTFDEAIIFTGRSSSDLYKLTSNRKIKFSKPTGKLIYFKRTDLEDWMLSKEIETLSYLHENSIKNVKIGK